MGIDNLLIVAGEDLVNVGVDYIKRVACLMSELFSSVSVEVAPLAENEYRELFECGAEGVACYQETYNSELYKKYHPAGPKRDYKKRLNTHDRAGRAGMRFLGIGSLLGLNDYREEAGYLALHARYLQKQYWKSQISVSFPRIRPCEGGFVPEYQVDDEQLLQMITTLRLFLPDANLVLSTREDPELRNKAVLYGINQVSAGSRTNPLGYSETGNDNVKQFEIADHRTPEEMALFFSGFGYDPVFKDWDRGFRQY
jgi:2-iminoacetate synthase